MVRDFGSSEIIINKFNIIDVLFSGGLSDNTPPTYKTIKTPSIPIDKIDKKTIGINILLFDSENFEKIEFDGLFLNSKISLIKNVINNTKGIVINIS